jgi:hypothetical protein
MFLFCSHDEVSIRNVSAMAEASPTDSQSESERLDVAVEQAIEACGGDLRSTIRALILANEFLEHELETKVSQGYVRGVKQGGSTPIRDRDDDRRCERP